MILSVTMTKRIKESKVNWSFKEGLSLALLLQRRIVLTTLWRWTFRTNWKESLWRLLSNQSLHQRKRHNLKDNFIKVPQTPWSTKRRKDSRRSLKRNNKDHGNFIKDQRFRYIIPLESKFTAIVKTIMGIFVGYSVFTNEF